MTHLWTDTSEVNARRFLIAWCLALRWPRLPAFATLAKLLLTHLEGILASCHVQVPFGVVAAINGNLRAGRRRGRGYRDHDYVLLKVQPATAGSRRLRAA